MSLPVFRSAFSQADAQNPQSGKKPVIFDILGPDEETSILPDHLKMVLHVNPTSISISYAKIVERTQTIGGFVEQHWGSGPTGIDMEISTGGFMRLYTGMSNSTGGPGSIQTGGNRRETIAYDKYQDLLALFHNNGAVYDTTGKIVFTGAIQITFDGGVYTGWFSSFQSSEDPTSPFQFKVTCSFVVSKEVVRFNSPMSFSAIGPNGAAGLTSSLDSLQSLGSRVS